MNRVALKEMLYGSLKEMLSNSKFIYNSNIDPTYSEWTEFGKTEIMEFLKHVSFLMARAEREELDYRAKEMVLESLKNNGE